MKELTFRVVQSHTEAERIWKQLSPNFYLNDDWDFRYTFFKYKECDLYFIVGYDGKKIAGLLPLQYNPSKELLQSFSDRSSDDTILWLQPGYKRTAQQFFAQIKQPAEISLGSKPYNFGPYKAEFSAFKYTLPLGGFTDYRDYITKLWPAKNAKRILKEMDQLLTQNEVEIIFNDQDDLELLFALNLGRFTETSSFRLHSTRQAYRDIIKIFPSEIMTIKINGEKQAVTAAIIYHEDHYFGLNNGTNRSVNNLGKFCYLIKIDRAIKLGMKSYGAGVKDFGGWKELFQFEKIPHYTLQLPGQ